MVGHGYNSPTLKIPGTGCDDDLVRRDRLLGRQVCCRSAVDLGAPLRRRGFRRDDPGPCRRCRIATGGNLAAEETSGGRHFPEPIRLPRRVRRAVRSRSLGKQVAHSPMPSLPGHSRRRERRAREISGSLSRERQQVREGVGLQRVQRNVAALSAIPGQSGQNACAGRRIGSSVGSGKDSQNPETSLRCRLPITRLGHPTSEATLSEDAASVAGTVAELGEPPRSVGSIGMRIPKPEAVAAIPA